MREGEPVCLNAKTRRGTHASDIIVGDYSAHILSAAAWTHCGHRLHHRYLPNISVDLFEGFTRISVRPPSLFGGVC